MFSLVIEDTNANVRDILVEDFQKTIIDYICSGHTLLNVDTFEKDRAISEIAEVAETVGKKIRVWSISQGWIDDKGKSITSIKPTAPVEDHVSNIIEFPDNVVCVFRDFGVYMQNATYQKHDIVIGWLDVIRKMISSVGQTIIFVGPGFHVPQQLLHDITQVDFSLPDNEQIKERIEFVCKNVENADGSKFEVNPEIVPHVIDACRGMTATQVADRVSLALRKHKGLDDESIQTIVREKASIIKASGLLTYIEPPEGGLSDVGGYQALKDHVLLDQPCFSQEARDFGIEYPRGLMLAGVPGCGKTLLSLAIASELNLPLISLDVGNVMNKYVGESESNMREAIKMLESIAPCVLVLDEIEKGFGGVGDTDGGASRRVFGTFLTWMSDRHSPVYIIATANQVESLPPEFCRTGRFDAIFGLSLPHLSERQEIFSIHLEKRDRNPSKFMIPELAEATATFTGSDIEQVIKIGLKRAFSTNSNLTTTHLIEAISDVVPLYKTAKNRVDAITEWCSKHARPANPSTKNSPQKTNDRKISLN